MNTLNSTFFPEAIAVQKIKIQRTHKVLFYYIHRCLLCVPSFSKSGDLQAQLREEDTDACLSLKIPSTYLQFVSNH